MAKLILLRHGQSTWNHENLFTGWVDVDLTELGAQEARRGGHLLREAGVLPTVCHTSVLIRAIRTAILTLDECERMWIPVRRSWRLNERHYGGLQGLNKAQMAEKFGQEQVHLWRRSYDVPPPPIEPGSRWDQSDDPRYAAITPQIVPRSECLADVVVRMLPYWFDSLVPDLRAGETVLVAAHGNSLRALVKHLEGISDEDIPGLNIPTGVPRVYDLDDDLGVRSAEYLGDLEQVAAAAAAVANQAARRGIARMQPAVHTAERARRWLELDPDPQTRAELEALLAAGTDLEQRFAGRLEFGTAGLRGALGAGPLRMNRVVVRQATAGVAARLAQDMSPASTIVAVGRDARHKSDVFARDVAGVLAQAGFDVRYWPDPVPTPLLAYAVRLLGAGAGVQVTASHNPANDNGYKVYWRGGGQITPPLDAEISRAIDLTPTPTSVPQEAGRPLPSDLVDAYRAAVLALSPHPEHRDLRIVYTPIHGVAGALAVDVLHRAGFSDVAVVDEQFAPDPDFPTVEFPNPEEPGALDAALRLAAERDAHLVLANDPDGDRVAAAVPSADGWRRLTGDEIGCVLADYLLEQQPGGSERMVATTVVSSQLLRRIAGGYGVAYAETLTGLKWLARAADRAAAEGRRMVIGYEEALGVMIGDVVRDKDGMSAALVLADCAAYERVRGRSLLDRLDDLARRFGLHAKAQLSVRYDPGDDVAAAVLDRLRRNTPERVADAHVIAVADYAAGERRAADGTVSPLEIPHTNMVGLEFHDGGRVQVRPSGTEPKLKLYIEIVEPASDGDIAATRQRAAKRLAAVTDAFLDAAGVQGERQRGSQGVA